MYTEMMIANLSSKFDGIMLKYTGKPRTSLKSTDIRESKNYKYFQQLVDILNNFPNIDSDLYIEAQVYWASKNNRPCNPSWLTTENAIKRYIEFLQTRNNTVVAYKDEYKKIVLESLKQSILFLTKKMKEYGLKSIEEVLNYKKDGALQPESFMWILNYSVTKPFLSIYNKYNEYYASLDDDIKTDIPNPKELEKMKRYIILNKDLSTFCREIVNGGS
jgi:hypothetical protein